MAQDTITSNYKNEKSAKADQENQKNTIRHEIC